MTEQELREKIAKRVTSSRCEVCNACGASISTDNPNEVAAEILAFVKEVGYVKRAEDQSLPNDPTHTGKRFYKAGEKRAFTTGYFACGQDMLKAVWRKIQVKDETL